LDWIIKAAEQGDVDVLHDAIANKGYDVNSIFDMRPGYVSGMKLILDFLNQSLDMGQLWARMHVYVMCDVYSVA